MATIGGGMMTTEIEKQFFEAFGIKPLYLVPKLASAEWSKDYEKPTYKDLSETTTPIYPEITDRILLELMCIFNQAQKRVYSSIDILESDIDSLKNSVLKWSIWLNKAYKKGYFKQQVQALFKDK